MQIGMIDTLEVSYDILDYNSKLEGFLKMLEQKKQEAKKLREETYKTDITIEINNEFFEVLPNGTANHAYLLHNNSYEIKFAKFRSSNASFYPIVVRLKSNLLWSDSVEISCEYIKDFFNWIIEKYCKESKHVYINEKVKRIDLCCHTDEFHINDDRISEFLGKYNSNVIYRNNDEIETFCLGARTNPIYCRIYNKSKEVLNNPKKLWFLDIWNRKEFDVSKVWNVEFELKREILKGNNITTTKELFKNIKSLWLYCTEKWLEHKVLERTRKERCKTSEQWKKIQHSFDAYKGESYISRNRQSEINADGLVPATIGYATSYASKFKDMDIHTALEEIFHKGMIYLKNKNSDYNSEIIKKRKLS